MAKERWSPLKSGWWKLNTVATYTNGRAALAFVIRDNFELLVKALSKTMSASSAYEVEVKAFEWGLLVSDSEEWQKFIFSSDALQVVKDVNSVKDPKGGILGNMCC